MCGRLPPNPAVKVHCNNLVSGIIRHINIFDMDINNWIKSCEYLSNFRWGLFVISCPIIFSNLGATPKINHPPSVLRKAETECIPSFSSLVVFFNSKIRDSSDAISLFISSIVVNLSVYFETWGNASQ